MESDSPVLFTDKKMDISSNPEFDVKKYQPYIDDFDLTDAQKQELLQTLWSIMVDFVDIGFEVDVVQALFKNQNDVSSNSEGDDLKIISNTDRFNLVSVGVQKKEDGS